jgi:hypothetical protein
VVPSQLVSGGERRQDLWWCAKPFLASASLLALFHCLGARFLQDYALQLGSYTLPEPRESYLWSAAATFGLPASAFLAMGICRVAAIAPRLRSALELFPGTDDKVWIAFGALAAFFAPFTIRMLVLDDAPTADDESAYAFGAQLVASGHLTAPSPPMKLFVDRSFMINDGHLYPMYFMGWPILMAPGVWFGAAGYMNAIYAALTIPAVYIAGRELGGRPVARASILLCIGSPMLAIAAATQMANTTCLAALAWMLASFLRTRGERASLGWHAGVGAFFGLAVLVRPLPAVGIGAPVLVAWALDTVRGPRAALPLRALAFGIPGALALALFVAINKVQNGSYTVVSYLREFEYAKENGLRFNNWGVPGFREHVLAGTLTPHFQGRSISGRLGNAGVALLRLNTLLFGWFPSLGFAAFGTKGRGRVLLGAMVLGHLVAHADVLDLGTDTFGPHHYFEMALPLVLLTALGAQAAARWLAECSTTGEGRTAPLVIFPGALLVSLTVFAVIGTWPPRIRALLEMAADVNLARDFVRDHEVHKAVIFSPRPFTATYAGCSSGARHFVYWRPNNDPKLENDVLWVNHVSVAEDRKFLENFPDRRGIIYVIDKTCSRRFVPLESPEADAIGPGDVDGIGTGIIRRGLR